MNQMTKYSKFDKLIEADHTISRSHMISKIWYYSQKAETKQNVSCVRIIWLYRERVLMWRVVVLNTCKMQSTHRLNIVVQMWHIISYNNNNVSNTTFPMTIKSFNIWLLIFYIIYNHHVMLISKSWPWFTLISYNVNNHVIIDSACYFGVPTWVDRQVFFLRWSGFFITRINIDSIKYSWTRNTIVRVIATEFGRLSHNMAFDCNIMQRPESLSTELLGYSEDRTIVQS